MKTLLIVDVQNDFLPGGSLEVKNGDEIIPVINNISNDFELVVATQDWHPQDHGSFASNHQGKNPFEKTELQGLEQILWPDHCVQGSKGAAFSTDLDVRPVEAIIRKGMDPGIDSYSGFFDNGHKKSTGLADYLRGRKANDLYIAGLAADVCVYFSAKDAVEQGFVTYIIEDATHPLDDEKFAEIKRELESKGVKFIQSNEL